ncbi:hypothetical protein TNCV_2097121 [Trichonephila clavipes]|nr:hypothetical protein TNCV_2097121 [Trichonephila clavipes]
MPRHVAAVISNNGGYSGYRFWQEPHFTEVYKFNPLILGQHVVYKISFVVLSLVFLGVAFTVASSVFRRAKPSGQSNGLVIGCHEFEPSTAKDPPCTLNMPMLKRPPIGVMRKLGASSHSQVSSSSLDHGSKFRGPSSKAFQ